MVFELDDLYDVAEQSCPKTDRLASIKTAMISLFPEHNSFGLQAIKLVFEAMEEESLLTANDSLNLDRYL